MNIEINEGCDLNKSGIYKIINIENGMYYVGSTIMSIYKRILHHYSVLNVNKHKNKYLQNAWNKHGKSCFKLLAVENVEKEKCLEVEQFYINQADKSMLYNINMLASGHAQFSNEILKKRSESIKKTQSKGSEYYFLVKNKQISIDDVPEKYKKLVNYRLSHVPWNKGRSKLDTDFNFLKGVKRVFTEEGLSKRRKAFREKCLQVFAYDKDYNFLGRWDNAYELEIDSKSENFTLRDFMILKNKVGRNGYTPYILQPVNILKSCKKGIIYKGLYFSNKPLHDVSYVEKSDKNGELCDENTVLN